MSFLIAVSELQGKGIRWIVAGKFTGTTWDRLWTDLRVSEERWSEWHTEGPGALLFPDMPAISQLVYIDEGTTSIEPVLLTQDGNRALGIATEPDVRMMLLDRRTAAESSIQSGSTIESVLLLVNRLVINFPLKAATSNVRRLLTRSEPRATQRSSRW